MAYRPGKAKNLGDVSARIRVFRRVDARLLAIATSLVTSAKAELCDQIGLSVILSVCPCAASRKTLCMDLHEILPMVSLGAFSR